MGRSKLACFETEHALPLLASEIGHSGQLDTPHVAEHNFCIRCMWN